MFSVNFFFFFFFFNFSAKNTATIDFMSTVRLIRFLTNDFVMQTVPSCSKLTTSLVNNSLKFQTLISQIWQYFFVEKM